MRNDEAEPDDERRALLSAFLTEHRYRIDPATPCDVADAAGINRRWYALAESGEPTRSSARVLRVLGDVLRLTPREHEILLRLAPPYLDRDTPRAESLEMRSGFASLRHYLRKLYACSTTDEVLGLVQDTAASLFPEAPYLTTAWRRPGGRWLRHPEVTGGGRRLRAFVSLQESVVDPIFASEPTAADLLTCFPTRSLPGEFVTFDDRDEALKAALGRAFEGFKQVHESSLAAVIRSRTGFVAHLFLGDFRTTYEDHVDRALLSTIVEFASLAPLR